MGAQPAALFRHPRHQPGRTGAVRLRAADRACPPGRVEAAPGAAADAGRARQHQGSARHFREGRPREPARHAAVHQRRPAARVQPPRRHAHARRPRRRVHRSGLLPREVHRLSREGSGAEDERLVPARVRQVRAEAPARRRADPRLREAARHRDARAAQHAGGVPPRGLADERRRSADRVGQGEGGSPRARRAGPRRPAAAAGALGVHSAQRHHHHPRRASPSR